VTAPLESSHPLDDEDASCSGPQIAEGQSIGEALGKTLVIDPAAQATSGVTRGRKVRNFPIRQALHAREGLAEGEPFDSHGRAGGLHVPRSR